MRLLLLLAIAAVLQPHALAAESLQGAAAAAGGDATGGSSSSIRIGGRQLHEGGGDDPRVAAGVKRLLQAAKLYRSRLPGGQTMLRPRQIHRALYGGDLERLRNFVRRMALGESLTLALMGGSVSKGMGAVAGEPSLEAWLGGWLAQVAPLAGTAVGGAGGDVGGAGGAAGGGEGGVGAVVAAPAGSQRSTVRLVNAACPATSSAYMNMCLREYLREPERVDLILLEYAINDEAFPDPPWENEHRKSFELLVRKLLRLPRRPPVVLLNTYRWHSEGALRGPTGTKRPSGGIYYTNTEAHYFEFATYYGLPMISLKAAVYHQMMAGVRGCQVHSLRYQTRENSSSDPAALFYEDGMHPSGLTGHRVLSELVIAMLLHAARSLEARPWRQSEEEHIRAPLPRPMIPRIGANYSVSEGWQRGASQQQQEDGEGDEGGGYGQLDRCLLGDNLRAAAVEAQGFEWLNEGRNPQAPKWGFTATAPGSHITFQPLGLDTPASSALNGTAVAAASTTGASAPPVSVLVILAYLRSYENMGVAEVSCLGGAGCMCGGSADGAVVLRLDGHWAQRTSQLQLGCFPALLAPGCRVRVRVAAESSSGKHKVKLGGLIVSHSAPGLAQDMCRDNLEATQRAAGYREM
ncbi:hypothetical protein Agub_g15107 [Astrephomene gubernaculifera]|uniref:SGNH hydrolase-type esterase domain-containing protein n=1 Tax=Astrephomene gubernaculifera TaxID=47775 RepID=A0AAD3HST8_9CHLO|nr:hypothetical protein Agub_g15107 [Astrephomene gubernaculifera]